MKTNLWKYRKNRLIAFLVCFALVFTVGASINVGKKASAASYPGDSKTEMGMIGGDKDWNDTLDRAYNFNIKLRRYRKGFRAN